jgi:hypothetical protein
MTMTAATTPMMSPVRLDDGDAGTGSGMGAAAIGAADIVVGSAAKLGDCGGGGGAGAGATGRDAAAAGIEIVVEPKEGVEAGAGADTGLSSTPQWTQNLAVA